MPWKRIAIVALLVFGIVMGALSLVIWASADRGQLPFRYAGFE